MIRSRATTIDPLEVHEGRWTWAAEIEWLPIVSQADPDGHASLFEAGYGNLVKAVANSAPWGCAVQYRIISSGSDDGRSVLTVWVVGSAASIDEAQKLWHVVCATLPEEIPLRSGGPNVTRRVLGWIRPDAVEPDTFIEVLRAVEDVSATSLDPSSGDPPGMPTVLAWDPVQQPLRSVIGMLNQHPARCSLVLHMERQLPGADVLDHLLTTFQVAQQMTDANDDQYLRMKEVATQSRRRIQSLRRGGVHIRVCIASEGPIIAGTAESVGVDLTNPSTGFELACPTDKQAVRTAMKLLTECDSLQWGAAELDHAVDELRYLADHNEAARVVRLPNAPITGFPGVATSRPMSLPRSPQIQPPQGERTRRRDVVLGDSPFGGSVALTSQEINQHVMVAGLPGFGKTRTVQIILRQLWNDHEIPFLVLDPAKADYGPFVASLGPGGQHYVLGPDDMAFNPFAVPQGCSIYAHAARVLGALDGALRLSAQWPFGYIMLSRGVFRAYEECHEGTSPTLRSVYAAMGDLIRRSGMDTGTSRDQRAVLLGRLESMVRGPLGASLTGGESAGVDWAALLSRPTVIEFRGFTGPTERSLVFGLLVAGLISYREQHLHAEQLKHVTVLEEAHRVLADHGSAETEGVRLLAEAIAELRGSGEGFIVVDQAPTSLHPAVRKVTGSVISHRVTEHEERQSISNSMLLDERQSADLARLMPRQAVVYGAQRTAATLTTIRDASFAVPAHVSARTSLAHIAVVDPMICIGCPTMCQYREIGNASAINLTQKHIRITEHWDNDDMLETVGKAAWCIAAHQLGQDARAADPRWLLTQLHDQLTHYRQARARHTRG